MLEYFNTYARTKPAEGVAALESMALVYQEAEQGMAVSSKHIYEVDKGAAFNLYSLFLQAPESSYLETPMALRQTQAAIRAYFDLLSFFAG